MPFRLPGLPSRRPSPRGGHDEPPAVPITGDLARALLALGAATLAREELADLFSDEREAAEGLGSAVDTLGRGTAAALLGVRGAPRPAVLAAAADVFLEGNLAIPGELVPGGRLPDRLERAPRALLEAAGYALREHALDRHCSELLLGIQRQDGQPIAVHGPVTDAQAHVWLLGYLYDRVEAWVARDWLADEEREASRWWFSRWRAARPFRGDEFASGVREQEFSLVERPYQALGASPLEHMVDEGLLEGAGPRLRHLARQMVQSVPGVWAVESRAGEHAVFRHPLRGTRYRVREHADDTPYGAGAAALGRLIPFGDGTWLRSPGTAILPEQGLAPELVRRLADGVENDGGDLYPQARLEAVIHITMKERGLPSAVRPDLTPDGAAERLHDLTEALRDVGAATELDPAQAPPELAGVPGTTVVGWDVDVVLAEYLGALFQLSRKSRAVRQAERRRERDEKKKRKKTQGRR